MLELGISKKITLANKPQIKSSTDAYPFLEDVFADLTHEEFWILLLNRANKVIISHCISKGGFTGTVADSKIIFKIALQHNGCGMILFHNHPFNNLQPSNADKKLNEQLHHSGKLLEIPVLDYLITGENNYFSFADTE